MLVLLIGPPGSGKGTQGHILAKALKIPHISTGEIFRKIAESNQKESVLLNEYMSRGTLIPSDLVNNLVKEFLTDEISITGCILDGYPRTIEQAKFLENNYGGDLKIIYFDIDDQILINRITGRYSCANCNHTYNTFYNNTKKDNICDICGSNSFIYREDDNIVTLKERIKIYKDETYPIIEYYKGKAGFYSVDATKNPEQISLSLINLLKKI